jgi:hypothetical protein
MSASIHRRLFIAVVGGAAFVRPLFSFAQKEKSDVPLVDQVPPLLDHILLGCRNLQHGIDFVEKHTGLRATFGGVHPGRDTQNALLSLGTRRYLEIIAPDPQQHGDSHVAELVSQLKEPRLVGWAAHSGGIAALAAKLKQSGVSATGPTPGSRKRPDGKVLHWQTLNLDDGASGLLPFFIQWGEDTVHPSVDAPSGCQLLRFELLTPNPAALTKIAAQLSLDPPIAKGDAAKLHAVVGGPKGQLDLSS